MKKKIVFLPYDMDTAVGTNNEGSLVFSYNLEDTDHLESGADIFNGQKSVLWNNLRECFFDEIKAMYQKLRSEGTLSYDVVEKMFEDHQSKWPEAIFNEDAVIKYIDPLVSDGTAAYLPMLQGSKTEQRKWWLYNRFRYLDSKYNAGDALSDVIQLRGYAKADITVTPYADIYPAVKYGSYLVSTRGERNKAATLACPLDSVNDTEIYIYSASQLASVGDLSGLMVGFADFSKGTKLQSIKIGDKSDTYSNGNLTELDLGNNTLLKTIDVRNCPSLMKAVDLSGCSNIEEAYFEGTSITGLSFPDGGVLKVLHLPSTVTNLTILNQTALTDFSIPSYSNISTLRLENVGPGIDTKAVLQAIPASSRVRLTGFAWECTDADEIASLLDILDTMRGLDENGRNMDKAQVSGTIHADTLTGAQVADFSSRYPYLKVSADHLTANIYYYTYDGAELLYTEEVKDGGNGGSYTGTPARAATAANTYTFIGWSKTKNSTTVDADALTGITADRNVYAAYSIQGQVYTVYFYNGSTLLKSYSSIPYGGTASYEGDTPVKTGVDDPEDYSFTGWSPSGENITGTTYCYAQYRYVGYVSLRLIEHSLAEGYENSRVSTVKFNALYKDNLLKNISLPAAKTIGSYAFSQCSSLTDVNLPEAESIGSSAFSQCYALRSAVIPKAKTIGGSAFRYCRALREIDLQGAESVYTEAFYYCDTLRSVKFGDSLKTLEYGAFKACYGLSGSLTFPETLTSIGGSAFEHAKITEMHFLGTPKTISSTAFSLTSLTDIYVPWSEGAVSGAPWGATSATIHYDTVESETVDSEMAQGD